MPSASKEIGAETALARKDRSVHIVETGSTGFAGGRKHTERDDGLFRIRGRQNDHPGTERRVRNHQRHWIYVERQIVELRIAFTGQVRSKSARKAAVLSKAEIILSSLHCCIEHHSAYSTT